jgi:predicted permease
VAVRTALGAGWRRLVHQFLVESTLLTLAGVGLGLLFAFLGLELLLALAPGGIPRLAEVGINGRVLWCTLGASALVALAVGVMPVMQARRADLHATLKEEGRGATTDPGRSRLRAALVTAELALAVVLLAGAGLLLKSFWLLHRVDPGFRVDGVLKAEFQLPETRYPRSFAKWPNWQEQRHFQDAVLERVLALPGVEAATVAGNHPLDPGYTNSFYVVGREAEARDWPEISVRRVGFGYFETLRLPLVRGRLLRAADDVAAPSVLVINEEAAHRFFADRNPLGQQINFWGSSRTIVGIVRDERIHGLAAAPPPALYAPLPQCPSADGAGTLLVRARGDLAALMPSVRAAVREVDPELAVFGVEPLAATLDESLARQRFTMLLVTVFAGLTLVVAVIGVYGILSYIVAQRTPEMGIRMALGAAPGDVVRLIVVQGARLAFRGLVLGLAGAFVLMRFLQGLLFGVGTADPAIFTLVLALVFAAAVAASWLPARRATRRDPMRILRAS